MLGIATQPSTVFAILMPYPASILPASATVALTVTLYRSRWLGYLWREEALTAWPGSVALGMNPAHCETGIRPPSQANQCDV